MSDIFENEIDDDNGNLASLEDNEDTGDSGESIVFDKPLYRLKLDYSSESIFAKMDTIKDLKSGDYVVAPTRYGNDMVRVLGVAQKPIGVKPSEIVSIVRKATKEDLKTLEELRNKEKEA